MPSECRGSVCEKSLSTWSFIWTVSAARIPGRADEHPADASQKHAVHSARLGRGAHRERPADGVGEKRVPGEGLHAAHRPADDEVDPVDSPASERALLGTDVVGNRGEGPCGKPAAFAGAPHRAHPTCAAPSVRPLSSSNSPSSIDSYVRGFVMGVWVLSTCDFPRRM